MQHGGGWRALIVGEDSKPKRKVDRQTLRRVFNYGRPYVGPISIVLFAIVVVSLLGLVPPLLYRALIDNVLPNGDIRRLNLYALAMLAIPLLSGGFSVLQRHYSAFAGEGIIFDLRQGMYEHLQGMSIRFFTDTKSGEIVSRFNSDVVGAQTAVTGTLPNIVTNVVTLVSTLAIMVTIEWRLTLLAVLVLPLFLLPARRVARILRDIRRTAMEHNANLSSIISETLSVNGALLVKTFGTQQREKGHFTEINGEVRDIGVRRAQVSQIFFLGLSMAATIGTALIYWAGGWLVIREAITIGTIVAFAAYLTRLYGPISSITNMQVEFAQAMVSFERVFEYLDLPAEIVDQPEAVRLNDVQGRVEFKNVWFQYQEAPDLEPEVSVDDEEVDGLFDETSHGVGVLADGEASSEHSQYAEQRDESDPGGAGIDESSDEDTMPAKVRLWALRDVSFRIEPGELVALVGPSGAGKTTITYLLPRLYDPTSGSVYIDGVDLRDATQESIAHQIGMVTQETYLFHDTIRANLLYANPDASNADLEAACRAANIHEMIASMPEGFETVVGERGYRLSGGEKQRISIARVILKDPQILVLDEATSHLDSQNEALIQSALEPLFENRTSIVIAHRLSTVLAADKILVLENGQLVESGTHEQLLEVNGLYTQLYEKQFGEEFTFAP